VKTSLLFPTVWSSSDIRPHGKYKVESLSLSSDFHYKVPVSRQGRDIDDIGRSFSLVYPGKYRSDNISWVNITFFKMNSN